MFEFSGRLFAVPLVSRDGDDGHLRRGAGFGERRHHQQEHEHLLGMQVAVVDPEPAIAVERRRIGIGRRGRARMDMNERRRIRRDHRHACCPPLDDVRGGHLDAGGQLRQNLLQRARAHRNLVGPVRWAAGQDELVALRRQAEQRFDTADVVLHAARGMGPKEDPGPAQFPRLAAARADRAGLLDVTNGAGHRAEARILRAALRRRQRIVVDAVDAAHRERQQEAGVMSGVDHGENSLRRDRPQQAVDEALAGQRGVGDGRAIGVAAGRADIAILLRRRVMGAETTEPRHQPGFAVRAC